MEVSIVYEGNTMTVREIVGSFVEASPEIQEILGYSATVEELVWHLPEVIVKEVLFLPIFFILKLVTLPVIGILNAVLIPKKKRGKRLLGLVVGAAEGLLCFLVVMVPVFGLESTAVVFCNEFKNSDNEALVSLSETVEKEFIMPLEASAVTKTFDRIGIRSVCTKTFDALSHTVIQTKNGTKDVEYFHTLEGALPVVNAFLHLKSLDISNIQTDDFDKLNDVFAAVSDSEEMSDILVEVTNNAIKDSVDEEYRETAGKIAESFVSNIIEKNKETDGGVDLEKEFTAIQTVMDVVSNATSSGVESVFAEKDVDTIVDTIVSTDVAYDTFIDIVKDEETSAVLKEEIVLDEEKKEEAKSVIDSYLSEKQETATPEEFARIQEAANAIAGMLDITLSELMDPSLIPAA